MIRLVLAFATLSMSALTPVVPAVADTVSPPDFGIIAFCKYDVATNHPELNVGDCVASRTTSYRSLEGWSEHVCFFYQNELPDLFYAAYDDYDDCVRDKASAI